MQARSIRRLTWCMGRQSMHTCSATHLSTRQLRLCCTQQAAGILRYVAPAVSKAWQAALVACGDTCRCTFRRSKQYGRPRPVGRQEVQDHVVLLCALQQQVQHLPAAERSYVQSFVSSCWHSANGHGQPSFAVACPATRLTCSGHLLHLAGPSKGHKPHQEWCASSLTSLHAACPAHAVSYQLMA